MRLQQIIKERLFYNLILTECQNSFLSTSYVSRTQHLKYVSFVRIVIAFWTNSCRCMKAEKV